jgi:Cys-rich protein (TIGR01571 family)
VRVIHLAGIFYAGGTLFFGLGALAMVPIISVFTSPLHYNVRKAFKGQNGIPHGPGCCPDMAYLCFCDPCVLCQELRELDMRRPVVTMVSPMHMPTMVAAPQPGVMVMSATVQAPQHPQAVLMVPGKTM